MTRIAIAFAAALIAAPITFATGVAGPDDSANPPAVTSDAASGRAAIRDACMKDVETLCSGVEPGNRRILQCLRDHKDQVSQECKEAAAAVRAARRQGD